MIICYIRACMQKSYLHLSFLYRHVCVWHAFKDTCLDLYTYNMLCNLIDTHTYIYIYIKRYIYICKYACLYIYIYLSKCLYFSFFNVTLLQWCLKSPVSLTAGLEPNQGHMGMSKLFGRTAWGCFTYYALRKHPMPGNESMRT